MRHRFQSDRRGKAGSSLFEVLVALFVLALLLGGVMALTLVVRRIDTRNQAESPMANAGRASADEINYRLRAASLVVATSSASSVASSGSSINLKLQAFNTTLGNPVLTGVYDYVAFVYDSTARTLSETVVPGTLSTRAGRNNFVLATKVISVTYTYLVRNQFTANTTGSVTKTLTATPTATPTVYVLGAGTSNFTYTVGSQQITVNGLTNGNDFEVVYPISPTANSGGDLLWVTGVNAQIVLQTLDGFAITRTVTEATGARFRNQRI